MLRVNRVINNNVISVLEDDREVILTGRGLGYQQHPGGTYDPSRGRGALRPRRRQVRRGFTSVIAEIPYEILVLSNQIADHLKATLDLTLTSAMQLAIADHIQFAMQRLASGQRLEHAMLWELKSTYRREFTAALEILDMIHASTGAVMPVDEAAFLTMHLVNAELNGDMSTTLSTTTAVQDIVALVRDQLGVPLEPDSVAYARS